MSKKTGKVYWYNPRTKKSSWKKPEDSQPGKKKASKSVLALVYERLLADALAGKHKQKVHVLDIGCGKDDNVVLNWLRARQRGGGGTFAYVGVDTEVPDGPCESATMYYCHDVLAEGLPSTLTEKRRFDLVLVQGLQYVWRPEVVQDIASATKHGGTFSGTLADHTILEKIVKGDYKAPKEYTIESDAYFSPSETSMQGEYISMQGRFTAPVPEDEFVSTLRRYSFLPLPSSLVVSTVAASTALSTRQDVQLEGTVLESMVQFVHRWAYLYKQIEMDPNTCQLLGMMRLFRATRRDELFRAMYE